MELVQDTDKTKIIPKHAKINKYLVNLYFICHFKYRFIEGNCPAIRHIYILRREAKPLRVFYGCGIYLRTLWRGCIGDPHRYTRKGFAPHLQDIFVLCEGRVKAPTAFYVVRDTEGSEAVTDLLYAVAIVLIFFIK
ncbi:MAG: hypothetical protein LBC76_01765 [Treponema sp.]|nr:hypothetical protein [Treponema sp.]